MKLLFLNSGSCEVSIERIEGRMPIGEAKISQTAELMKVKFSQWLDLSCFRSFSYIHWASKGEGVLLTSRGTWRERLPVHLAVSIIINIWKKSRFINHVHSVCFLCQHTQTAWPVVTDNVLLQSRHLSGCIERHLGWGETFIWVCAEFIRG